MINNRYSYKRKKNKAKTKKTKGGGGGFSRLFRSICGSASVAPIGDYVSDGVYEGPGVIESRNIYNAEITRRKRIREDITNYRKEIQSILKEGTRMFARYLTSNDVEFYKYMGSTDPQSGVNDGAYEQKLFDEHAKTAADLNAIKDHYKTYISQNPKSGGKKSRKYRKSKKYRK